MRLICPLVTLLALSASCATTSKQGQLKEAAEGSDQKKTAECEVREATTGSRIARKTCVTKEQKHREEREAQEFISRNQKPTPVQTGN